MREEGEALPAEVAAPSHAVSGPRFRLDAEGTGFWVRCRCGWESDLCGTDVLATASGEQHLLRYRG